MRRKHKKEIELTFEDVKLIMGKDLPFLNECLAQCFCGSCNPHPAQLTNYKVYLNDLDDLLFRGECNSCGRAVARYIETGENPESAGIANHIREIYQYKI